MTAFVVVQAGEQAAGRKDILAPGGADGGGNPAPGQTVPEGLHRRLRAGAVREIRNPVETDQVHAAFQPLEETKESVGMARGVVETREHRVLETYPALAREVVLTDQVDDRFDRVGLSTGIRERRSSGNGLCRLTARWHRHSSR